MIAETLKNLYPLVTPKLKCLTLEQASEFYRESLDPSLFALAFTKLYKQIVAVGNKYPGLTESDICSHALEKLDTCLRTYNASTARFITYYTKTLMNTFRTETEALNTDKRRIIYNSTSYDSLVEAGFDQEVFDAIEEDNLFETLACYGLTEKELMYCKLAAAELTNAEIAEYMNVSVMTISNIRKKLKEKLVPFALEY